MSATPTNASSADLAASARSSAACFDEVRAALAQLLAREYELGVGIAFDILAREPRIKPSRALLIDPDDSARRRWSQRVAAGVALVESIALARLFAEIHDELSESAELAADVLVSARVHPQVSAADRRTLLTLRRSATAGSPRPR